MLVRDLNRTLHWVALDPDDARARLPFPAAQARWHVGKFLGVH